MDDDFLSKKPKPFVFVLMPFETPFKDIYLYGIKGAAEDAGAYAERLDEQVFTEGMLDRIFNQISKADVIIADMTGRNPNVFYEVGYAHALGKIVLLITKSPTDIPFDLKHRQHTVYEGKIELLRKELTPKILWAIREGKRRGELAAIQRISARLHTTELSLSAGAEQLPTIKGIVRERYFSLPLVVRNDSPDAALGISHVYLFTSSHSKIEPANRQQQWFGASGSTLLTYVPAPVTEVNTFAPIQARDEDSRDGLTLQYRLPITFERFPPGAIEQKEIGFLLDTTVVLCEQAMRLRLHGDHRFWDYSFKMNIEFRPEEKGK